MITYYDLAASISSAVLHYPARQITVCDLVVISSAVPHYWGDLVIISSADPDYRQIQVSSVPYPVSSSTKAHHLFPSSVVSN